MSEIVDPTETQAETFAERFAAGWAAGGPTERFVEHFAPLCSPHVLLVQPLSPPLRGVAGLRRMAESLFGAMPDLRGEVLRWGATEDGVMIELRLRGTLAGKPVEWITVDRIVLRGGLIAERRAYFDPTPLLSALLSRPRAALRLMSGMRKRKENR
jgi:ketosteroid isomerase-like protein